jgi:hypothetical protein
MFGCDRMTTPLGTSRTKLCIFFLLIAKNIFFYIVFKWLLLFTALARVFIVMHYFKSTHLEI